MLLPRRQRSAASGGGDALDSYSSSLRPGPGIWFLFILLLDEEKGAGVVPQRGGGIGKKRERKEEKVESGGGGKSKARIGEIEDQKI